GPALSPDGNSLYFGSNRAGGSGLADLWVAKRADKNAPWQTPVNLGPTVNSTAMDNVPNFSRDGHWMFFNSNRTGGVGGNDIWMSFRSRMGTASTSARTEPEGPASLTSGSRSGRTRTRHGRHP